MLLAGFILIMLSYFLGHFLAQLRPPMSAKRMAKKTPVVFHSSLQFTLLEELLRENFKARYKSKNIELKHSEPGFLVFLEGSRWDHWGYFYSVQISPQNRETPGSEVRLFFESRLISTGSDSKHYLNFQEQLENFINQNELVGEIKVKLAAEKGT